MKLLIIGDSAGNLNAHQRPAKRRLPGNGPLRHAEVPERYNAVLMRKLETRNAAPHTTVSSLHTAHESFSLREA